MAITTHTKIINDADPSSRACIDEPKSNGQLFAVAIKNEFFLFLPNIMQPRRLFQSLMNAACS